MITIIIFFILNSTITIHKGFRLKDHFTFYYIFFCYDLIHFLNVQYLMFFNSLFPTLQQKIESFLIAQYLKIIKVVLIKTLSQTQYFCILLQLFFRNKGFWNLWSRKYASVFIIKLLYNFLETFPTAAYYFGSPFFFCTHSLYFHNLKNISVNYAVKTIIIQCIFYSARLLLFFQFASKRSYIFFVVLQIQVGTYRNEVIKE